MQWRKNGYMAKQRKQAHIEKTKGIAAGVIIVICILWSGYGDASLYASQKATGEAVEPETTQVSSPAVETLEAAEIKAVDVSTGTIREVSAYTSEVWQTDSTPCQSANGANICNLYEEGVQPCAANFVPFGTILYVDGLGECVVVDRMSSRYQNRVDWYMGMDTERAIQFGVKNLLVTQ